MAVYTHVSSEDISALLMRYDVGALVSAKGIAEGVENSNYLIETDRDAHARAYQLRQRRCAMGLSERLVERPARVL